MEDLQIASIFDPIFDAWDAAPDAGSLDLDAAIEGAVSDLTLAFGVPPDAPAMDAGADPSAVETGAVADPSGEESPAPGPDLAELEGE